MQFFKDRFNYLFRSTKGLILVAIAMIALETALFGMLSGPMAEVGVSDIVVRIFRMDLVQAEREGRIIILYHSIAMAIVAIETYMITGLLKMKEFYKLGVRALITVGYLMAMIFGMGVRLLGAQLGSARAVHRRADADLLCRRPPGHRPLALGQGRPPA